MPGRDIAGIAGRGKRWIDDCLLPLARRLDGFADRLDRVRGGIVFGVHAERGYLDLFSGGRQFSLKCVTAIPGQRAAGLIDKFKSAGQVRVHQVTRDPQAPEGKLALGRLVITLSNTPLLVPNDQGLWSQLRGGLAFSLRGLSISASWLIVGLLFVLPWVLVLYAAIWLARRLWRGEPVQPAVSAASVGNIPPASNP